MTRFRRGANDQPTAESFSSVLTAEARAREAICACQQQHDQALLDAKTQASRIYTRATGRVQKIKAAQVAHIQALSRPPEPAAASAVSTDIMQPEQQRLQAAVERLAERLSGAPT